MAPGSGTNLSETSNVTNARLNHGLKSMKVLVGITMCAAVISACGEPIYENVGSPNSLITDRETCALEIDHSPAAAAYRENPEAHPDYVSQVFHDMNRCLERRGWKEVRTPSEHEAVRDAIVQEAERTRPPVITDSSGTERFVRRVEERLAQGRANLSDVTKKE